MILQVALDTPLRRAFDYLPPLGAANAGESRPPRVGLRVRVPFGRRHLIGIIVGIATRSGVPAEKLKPVAQILDDAPVFDPVTLELLRLPPRCPRVCERVELRASPRRPGI